jgi:hypothetical protein
MQIDEAVRRIDESTEKSANTAQADAKKEQLIGSSP